MLIHRSAELISGEETREEFVKIWSIFVGSFELTKVTIHKDPQIYGIMKK